jgi:hypothetical protein
MKHRWNLVFGALAALLFGWALSLDRPRPAQAEVALEAPVPLQEWTADAGVIVLPTMKVVIGKLPSPGPNQIKESRKCEAPAQFKEGGCWLPIAGEQPPCDPAAGRQRKLWPDKGMCWFPVAEARPPPTTGEPRRHGGVAGP